jgi:hypothetical protein
MTDGDRPLPGTRVYPAASDRDWYDAVAELGHSQTVMFDSVHEEDDLDGPAKGYVVPLSLRSSDLGESVTSYVQDILKFGHRPNAAWLPTHRGVPMTQHFKPKNRLDAVPEAVSSSPQFHRLYDIQIPGLED